MPVSLPYTHTAGQAESASELMSNLNALVSGINNINVGSSGLSPSLGVVRPTGNTVLGTAEVDVTGCSLAITPTVASYLLVVAFASISFPIALRNVTLSLHSDGVLVTDAQCELQANPSAVSFQTGVLAARVSLSAAAHTVKLRAFQNTGTDCTLKSFGSGFAYLLVAQ